MAKYITVICRLKGETLLRLNTDFNCVENHVFYTNESDDDITVNDITTDDNNESFDISRVKEEVMDTYEDPEVDPSEDDYNFSNSDFEELNSFANEYQLKDDINGGIGGNDSSDTYRQYVSITKISGRQKFCCQYEDCKYETNWKNAIKNHVHNHLNYRPFVCEFKGCGHSFTIKSNLNNHQKVHLKNIFNKNNTEPKVKNKPKNRNKSKSSLESIDNKSLQTIRSQENLFKSDTNSSHSSNSLIPKEDNSFQKPFFVGIASVKKYFTESQRDGKVWRTCLLCKSYGSSYATSMVYHIRVHLKDCPFVCRHCGRGFAIKTNLNNHLAFHKPKTSHSDIQ